MRKAKGAEYEPRARNKRRPGKHKKSQNKNEKRQKKQTSYKGQG